MKLVASFPGLPRFLFFGLRSVQYMEAKEHEKRGRPGNTYHMFDVRWTRGGHGGGRCLISSTDAIRPESEFLTSQAEYLWSCERLESCLAIELSMIKSSTLFHVFECGIAPVQLIGHRPPYVHLASTWHHSHDRCFQAFPVFRALLLPCTEHKPKNKKRGRPGNEAIKLACVQQSSPKCVYHHYGHCSSLDLGLRNYIVNSNQSETAASSHWWLWSYRAWHSIRTLFDWMFWSRIVHVSCISIFLIHLFISHHYIIPVYIFISPVVCFMLLLTKVYMTETFHGIKFRCYVKLNNSTIIE